MKKVVGFFCLIVSSVFSLDTMPTLYESQYTKVPDKISLEEVSSERRMFPFVIASGVRYPYARHSFFIPMVGSGISLRNDQFAFDFTVQSCFFLNTASCSVSKIYCKPKSSFYLSGGVGGIMAVEGMFFESTGGVTVPLRMGIAGKHILFDGGVECMFFADTIFPRQKRGVAISPQMRFGYAF